MRAIALALAGFLLIPASAHATPIGSFDSFVEGTNPQYQHADGNVLWINGLASGSTTVRINATDAGPGIT